AGGNVQFSEWFPYPGLGWRYMDVRYYPLPGEDGQMELVAVHIRDATERKRAEEQLAAMRETAERRAAEAEEGQRILEALMDNIPEGIAIADALDGSVRLVSRYGRSFATHPDRPGAIPLNEYLNEWRRFFPDGRPVTDLADLPLTRAIQRGEVVRDEEWILEAPNGVRTPISCAAAPIHDREGRITGAVAAWRDISALKQAEAERERLLEDLRMARDQLEARVRERTDQLSKAVERLRQEVAERRKAQESLSEQSRILEAFFVGTQAPLVFLDKEFNFIRVNAAYARACQRAIDDFAGHNHFVDYPSEELREKFQRVVETKESYQVHARPFVFPDHPDWGTSYWDLSVVPILDAAGEVDFLVFSLLDVTERERADQELRALHREIADLSAREQWRIGQELHDNLGQQLTGVALMAQSLCQKLEERALPEAEVAAQLVACFRNSQNVVSALARGLAPVQIDSKGLMSALEELATQTAQLSGVECRFACEHPVEFNDQNTATHLYRIAQEAVRNAVRHANPRQVAVDLGLDETGRIRLQVQDDGMGIPPDISDSVGMGLRIMRYRAEIIGASLALAPGEEGGTRVTCVLAMPEDSSRSVPSGERSPWRPKTAKKKRAS
ncbi:MAG: PAS domain-containing protein, partial [Candidatus Sumerlaeota bacterium]|nr:PAS domain-containing protein [Candidatus Sumerlaeota bacterium]